MAKILASSEFFGNHRNKHTGVVIELYTNANLTLIQTRDAHKGTVENVSAKKIPAFVEKLNSDLNEGVLVWIGERNDAVIDSLKKFL